MCWTTCIYKDCLYTDYCYEIGRKWLRYLSYPGVTKALRYHNENKDAKTTTFTGVSFS